MNSTAKSMQRNPMKLYIQDIFRAQRTTENKYIYELFGLKFKNVLIQGVVTSIYNHLGKSTNFELSDPTGSVLVYYDSTKNNLNISSAVMKDLHSNYIDTSYSGDENIVIMTKLMSQISNKKNNPISFAEGSYLKVVGDIFVDDFRDVRMISAYECNSTSVQSDIVWLEELKYLYEKYYLSEMQK